MVLVGLSILIATVSFLCYHYPQRVQLILKKLESFSCKDVAKASSERTQLSSSQETCKTLGDQNNRSRGSEDNKKAKNPGIDAGRNDEDFDRRTMPPPPSPTVIAPSNPQESVGIDFATLNSPTFTSNESHVPSASSACNSAQRTRLRQGPRSLGSSRPNDSIQSKALSASVSSMPSRLSSRISPVPDRIPRGLAPSSSQATVPAKPSKKVLLAPGHSPLDWARLMSSNVLLASLPPGAPCLKIPPSQLKQYTGRKGKDAWTTLSGKVYNISPYLPYHPGGEPELLRCAGRDGTKLFAEVHPWVNWEGMLAKCMVGIAVEEDEVHGSSPLEEMD